MGGVFDRIAEHYSKTLRLHGATPRGAGWSSEPSQERRFTELLRVCRGDKAGSVNDYGCGYGSLAARLRRDGYTGDYVGYDVSQDMIIAANDLHGALERVSFTANQTALPRAAYTLASGIFNVRLDFPVPAWERYIRETIDAMAELSSAGFAFNMLTAQNDGGAKQMNLYYGDPAVWMNHCLRRFPRRVALAHDYPLYEFTIFVRGVSD